MVTGDFDLSGIGTVTHIEGDRVYGFGHPMFGLGSCQFPMMTGYIHTVYPRASVSMKMGSPLKTVGVLDTDVSTGVAGRLGKKPDMLPMSVKVRNGRYSEPQTYKVEIVREPNLLSSLVMAVLTNAIDTEGDLPDELTAHLKARIKLKGHDPIELDDVLSGARVYRPDGPGRDVRPGGIRGQRADAKSVRPGADRGDRRRGRDRSRAARSPRSSRSGWRAIGSSQGRRSGPSSRSSRTRASVRRSPSRCRFRTSSPRARTRPTSAT